MEREEELILIEKIKSGDDALYKILIDRYSPKILSIVRGVVRNQGDAEEVAQDVFVKAFFSLKKFRGDSSFSTWLYRIAYNMSVSKVRKKSRYVGMGDMGNFAAGQELFDGSDSEDENRNKENRFKILDIIINELDPADRFLLLSFYIHEKSIRELSEITGMGESNVKVKLHRIKKRLSALIDDKNMEVIYG
jgi:RNA polymerase sigma factor, sigma-70 family